MCYSTPAKSLEIARSRLTPEQWQRFEREFDDFCVVQGLSKPSWINRPEDIAYFWARWAFFQGRQQRTVERMRFQCAARGCDGCAVCMAQPTADQRVADAKYTRLALAMMDDEQAEQSLERWMGRGE